MHSSAQFAKQNACMLQPLLFQVGDRTMNFLPLLARVSVLSTSALEQYVQLNQLQTTPYCVKPSWCSGLSLTYKLFMIRIQIGWDKGTMMIAKAPEKAKNLVRQLVFHHVS